MKTTVTTMLAVVISLVAVESTFAQYQYEVRRVTRNYPTVYTYGARHHLDDLSVSLKRQANEIAWDMHRNYQGNPDFVETYSEMYELLQSAIHLHDLVHQSTRHHQNHHAHIVEDLHQMDALFHHIEDDIVNWQPTRFSHHFHQAHGSLHGRVEAMEDTLHHLMEDYGIQSNIGSPPPVSGALPPQAPSTFVNQPPFRP